MSVNWTSIWMSIFGTTSFLGLDMGFWVSMGISLLIAILMTIVFWGMKPKKKQSTEKNEKK